MRTPLLAVSFLILVFSCVSGQTDKKTQDQTTNQPALQTRDIADANKASALSNENEPETWLHFVGGRRLQVAEVTESSDGFWFKVGNVTTFVDRKRVARIERTSATKETTTNGSLRGSGNWKISDSARVESFFLSKFGRRLPLTALGQSDLHTQWGYDHRQGMDIGLHPDSAEGRGLIEFLRSEEIPFLAFRQAVPGVATGPHIHVGNPSRRLYTR